MSYLFVTHNISAVEYIADRIAVMRAGRNEEQGPCDDVLSRPTRDYTPTLLGGGTEVVLS